MEAVASLPDGDDSDDPDADAGTQLSLDDSVNPADRLGEKTGKH